MIQDRNSGGHSEIMENLFLNSKVLAYYIDDYYEGSEAYIYKLKTRYDHNEGAFIIVTDYFGSCSGCDAYENCSNDELRNLCIQLANNAHSFKSLGQLIDFITESDKDGAYYDVSQSKEILEKIKNIDNFIMVEKY